MQDSTNKRSIKDIASHWKSVRDINRHASIKPAQSKIEHRSQNKKADTVHEPSDASSLLHQLIKRSVIGTVRQQAISFEGFKTKLDEIFTQNNNQVDLHGNILDANHNNCTLLHTASRVNSVLIVSYLIEIRSMNVDCIDKLKATPLAHSCSSGSSDTCEILISHGADIDRKDFYGSFPLLIALRNNHYNCCDILILCGADINLTGSRSDRCLHYACEKGDLRALKYLLGSTPRIDLNLVAKNSMDQMPLAMALAHPCLIPDLLRSMRDYSIKTYGNDNNFHTWITNADGNGRSIFHECAEGGYIETLLLMIPYYTDNHLNVYLNRENALKRTPFSLAIQNNREEISRLFYLSREVTMDAQYAPNPSKESPGLIIHRPDPSSGMDSIRNNTVKLIELVNKLYISCVENKAIKLDGVTVLLSIIIDCLDDRFYTEIYVINSTIESCKSLERLKVLRDHKNDHMALKKKLREFVARINEGIEIELLSVLVSYIKDHILIADVPLYDKSVWPDVIGHPSHHPDQYVSAFSVICGFLTITPCSSILLTSKSIYEHRNLMINKLVLHNHYDIHRKGMVELIERGLYSIRDLEIVLPLIEKDAYQHSVFQKENALKFVKCIENGAPGMKRLKLCETPYPFVMEHEDCMRSKRIVMNPSFISKCVRLDELVIEGHIHEMVRPLLVLCAPRSIRSIKIDGFELSRLAAFMMNPYKCISKIYDTDGLMNYLNEANRNSVDLMLEECYGKLKDDLFNDVRYSRVFDSYVNSRGTFNIERIDVTGAIVNRIRSNITRILREMTSINYCQLLDTKTSGVAKRSVVY